MTQVHDVAIVGAGLAGLAAARFANNASLSTIVFEKADRVGGKAKTVKENGFVVELGPLGWLNREPRLLRMLDEIDAAPVSAADAQSNRYLVHSGSLTPLPTGPIAFMLSPLMSPAGRVRFVTEFLRKARRDGGDESVHDFATRRFGPQAAATLFEAFVSGVFAGDPRKLSVQAAFPLFTTFENKHGSIMAGGFQHMRKLREAKKLIEPGSLESRYKRGNLLTMPDGIGGLAQTLADSLPGQIHLEKFPDNIRREADGTWVLEFQGQELSRSKRLLMACPSDPTAELLKDLCPELTAAADGIPAASLSVVTLAFKREQASGIVDGFGFLAPRKENFRPLGVQFAHSIFPGQTPDGYLQLRVMLGGSLDPEAVAMDDEHLVQAAVEPLRPLLGLTGDPEKSWICRWKDVVPQYTLGHLERVAVFNAAEQRLPGLHFLGDSLHGVGVPAAISRAADVTDSWK